MKLIKVASCALNQTPLDWENNKNNIIQALDMAKAQKISILCLPELCITGYGCEDAFLAPFVSVSAFQTLKEIAPLTNDLIVCVGLPISYNKALFNTCCLLANGKILGFVAKHFLAGDGIHYEQRWFKPWPQNQVVSLEIEDEKYLLGDLLFLCGDIKIGFEICEDAWINDRPGADLARHGVDIILNPSASHFSFGKHEVRKRIVLEGSRAFGVSYIYSNLLGNEAGRAIYDGDSIIASCGKLIQVAKRFSFKNIELTNATIDIDASRLMQKKVTSFVPEFAQSQDRLVQVEFQFPLVSPQKNTIQQEPWETGQFIKEEEFTRAVSLALFDYMRKSKSQGFVISLSGGADSSAVACLVLFMLELALRELGERGVSEKLSYFKDLKTIQSHQQSRKEWMSKILTCVYQASENSSLITSNAAQKVAQAVFAQFFNLNISNCVKEYMGLVESALSRKLTWEQDDIALQNIQARVRSPGVWMIANIKKALLLTTSNRSEAAVGYATMDGDTSGGLCPLGGIDKNFLRHWLRWLQTKGPEQLFAISELSFVNEQNPTAELRPSSYEQTDEQDLMPYDLLDLIERLAIHDKKSPIEVFQEVSLVFSQYPKEKLRLWVTRFFKLWCQNQWKRERYAPSFHLDDENLDPKTGCRFPILSGGYEKELRDLQSFQL